MREIPQPEKPENAEQVTLGVEAPLHRQEYWNEQSEGAPSLLWIARAVSAFCVLALLSILFFSYSAAPRSTHTFDAPPKTREVRDPLEKQNSSIPTQISASADECVRRMRRLGVVYGPENCIELESIIDDLETGKYFIQVRETAYLNEKFLIRLVLQTSEGQNVEPLFENMPGKRVERVEKFAQHVEATLSGVDFQIRSTNAQLQLATRREPVVWEWDVTPSATGVRTLLVEVRAVIIHGNERTMVKLKTFYQKVVIDVRPTPALDVFSSLVGGTAQAATILGALPSCVLIYEFLRRRRRPVRKRGPKG